METEYWIPEETFGDRLRMFRTRQKIDAKELANELEVSQQTISFWEHGSNPKNMADIVSKISIKYGVDPVWLMWGNEKANELSGTGGARTRDRTILGFYENDSIDELIAV